MKDHAPLAAAAATLLREAHTGQGVLPAFSFLFVPWPGMWVIMEKWDIYDSQGKLTGKTKNKDDNFLNGEYHLASSLWIINNNGKALIQKRAASKALMPNKWSITGGAVVAGETSGQGCIREVQEELGLKLKENDITLLYRSIGKNLIYDDYIIACDFDIATAVLQTNEVSDAKWATIEEIRELFYSGDFMFEIIEELEKVENYIKSSIGK